jgi:hypothetical protein
MLGDYVIRWRWLRAMYIYTAVIAGGMGLAMIVVPGRVQSMSGMPAQDPVVFGLNGSLFLAFGLVALAGLRAPLKYCPLLLMELAYKTIWFAGVVVPLLLRGEFPRSAAMQAVIFVTFIVGELVAIPFRYLLAGDVESRGPAGGTAA